MLMGLIKYHLLVLLREPLNLFFGFGLPFLNLFIMSNTLDDGMVVDAAIPVFIIIATMVLCFTDSGLSHGYTRQIKFLRRLRMTPVKPAHYLLTGILSRIGVVLAFAATFIGVTVAFFDLSLEGRNWPLFIGVLLLIFVMFYMIGMFLANSLKNAKTSQNLIYVVFFGMLLLGGFMFPTNAMPEVMRTISRNLPPAYAEHILRAAWMSTDIFINHYFIAILGITAAFTLLTIKFYKYE